MTAPAPGPGPANELGGTVGGHAVQAHNIHGGLYIGARPGPGTPRPRQLPLPPAHFTDRTRPVAVITRAAAHGGPGCAIIVVSGPGGAGKTAVAVHALHQVADQYTGQLHAPLGTFGVAGPASPQAVLAGWLRALGVPPPAVPSDPAEAAALFRSLTAGAPVAVLADDAASETQVRALLPAAGLVVVTSRYQLSGLAAADGAHLVPLGPLDPAAATELATRITGRDSERASLAALAGYCGHLPLAVRAAAARLAARPALATAAVVADLAAARSRLTALDTPALEISVTASLDASYHALEANAASAYRLLATCPGTDITIPSAAALLDTGEPAAEQLTVALAAASLMEETTPGRWRYHDLVREHAAGLAAQHDPAAERKAATARVIDYYLRASAAADLLVLPRRLRIAPAFGLPNLNPPAFLTSAAALAWCDAELANLLQAQQTASSQGLHTLAWQFADTLWGWCTHRQRYPDWAALCQTAIESAHSCGDARAEVLAAVRLASCHIASGDTPAAAAISQQAIQTAWVNGDRAGEGSACEHAAMCALADGDYPAAIMHCNRGLACWRHITSHRRPEALLERLLGRAYAALGDHQQAAAHLDTALAVFTELGERYHSARTQYYIATTRLARSPGSEHTAEVITLLEQARPLLRAENHPLSLADLLITLADAHTRAGDAAQASACLQEAAALHLQLGLPPGHPARVRASAINSRLAIATIGEQPPRGADHGDQGA
jgi:tetratricopeptide (TPR) repeat protein